jgi:guanylate kinase
MMSRQLLGNNKRGLAFIVSAPAGTGKTTLVSRLTDEFSCVIASISTTTRQPRAGEIEGLHYHFISKSEFESKIAQGEFLEYVRLYGNYYGTSRRWVEEQLSAGKHVILVIDTQGAKLLRKIFPAVAIFLMPPSLAELARRLQGRGTESQAMLAERLALAEEELKALVHYDYKIVNDDLDVAYQVLKSIIIAEEHRVLTANL